MLLLIGLFPAHLEDFPVTVGVNMADERGAARRPVLRQEPAGLEPNPTSVAQSLRPHRSGPPLRRLLGTTVATPSLTAGSGGRRAGNLRFPAAFLRPSFRLGTLVHREEQS